MARGRIILAALSLACLVGCARASAPTELSGLWSASQPACAAGVGVRFQADAIEAVYENERQTLFENVSYKVERRGNAFRARITYDLPRLAGGAHTAGAHGVIVLVRRDGGVAPESHNLVDPRTGAVRVQLDNDPVQTLLTLEPCGPHPWRDPLRGRNGA
jgi:hypothetical protein